jgi:predicted porin
MGWGLEPHGGGVVLLITAAALALPSSVRAQEPLAEDSATAEDDRPSFLEGFRLYGSLRGQVAFYRRTFELQGNASRIGFRLTRDFFDDGVRVFGQVELGLRIMEDIAGFNVSGNPQSYGRLEAIGRRDPVFARLGFVGFDFGAYGLLAAGKQWSTYYDVSGYTDELWVFGGRGSGTYVRGSDGGGAGTGRASKAVTYRNQVGGFTIGAQTQLEANRLTGLGSIGGSVQYAFPFGLTLGAAGNVGDVPDTISKAILGAKEHEVAIVFGAAVQRPRWYAAFTYSIQESHDAVNVDTLTVAFDATGFEAIAYYDIGRRFRLSGGFNVLAPKPIGPIHPDFRIRFGVLGGAFYFNSQTLIYAEWKLEDSVNEVGLDQPNAFVLGVRLDFGLPELQRNDAPPLRFPESDG